MQNKHDVVVLKRLNNIPSCSKVLWVDTPFVWLVYIELSPSKCYYIEVEKRG